MMENGKIRQLHIHCFVYVEFYQKITTDVEKSLFWHVVFNANRFYPLTIFKKQTYYFWSFAINLRRSLVHSMHLHNHLKDCLLDFGQIHVLWCFSFKRFNGANEYFHTNNRAVEIQFMRKIMTSKSCDSFHDVTILIF